MKTVAKRQPLRFVDDRAEKEIARCDEVMNDRRQYDPPILLAICPTCGSQLESTPWAEDGCEWWCPGCENFFKDADLTR